VDQNFWGVTQQCVFLLALGVILVHAKLEQH
jgi:hypothetical protein